MAAAAVPSPILDDSDTGINSMKIGQRFQVECHSGHKRCCRAALFLETKSKKDQDNSLWMALPSILCCRNVIDAVKPHSRVTCMDSLAEIGPCELVTNTGNLCLVRLPFDIPQEKLKNYVTVDVGECVPHARKRNSAKLTDAKCFLLHQDGQQEEIKLLDTCKAFEYNDIDNGIKDWIALPVSDATANNLNHQDIGALITTTTPTVDGSHRVPACGVYSGQMEVKIEGGVKCKCCLIAPLWPAIDAIYQENFDEKEPLRVLMPVMDDGFDPTTTAGPSLPMVTPDVLESMGDMYNDSAYQTMSSADNSLL